MRYFLLSLFLLVSGAPQLRAQNARPSQGNPGMGAGLAIVTFQLNLAGEQAKVKLPNTIGLRGSTAPLSWEHTFPLSDENNDGIYEATVSFSVTAPGQTVEYKYVYDSVVWESTGNRILPLKMGLRTLPVQRWDTGPPDPALAAAKALQQEMRALDSAMFAAYNARDLDKLMAFFSEDLEFYHDRGGLSNFAQNRQASQEIFARPDAPHRELVPGSLEVFPVKDYGAMVIGAHRFCHIENGKDDCGTFRFSAVWQKKDGTWKVTRMLSYGH